MTGEDDMMKFNQFEYSGVQEAFIVSPAGLRRLRVVELSPQSALVKMPRLRKGVYGLQVIAKDGSGSFRYFTYR